MILDLRQPPDDADQHFTLVCSKLFAQHAPACGPTRKGLYIQPERNDTELAAAAHAELFMYLPVLLRADGDDPVGRHARQHFFDQEKHARRERAVITMKDVAVIRMYEAERRGRKIKAEGTSHL